MTSAIITQDNYRGCVCSLSLDKDKSIDRCRAIYNYSVETPPFEVWTWNEQTKEYDIEQHSSVIFSGVEFAPAQGSLSDQDLILDDLLSWLTLKPGDTDQCFFAEYTTEQILWSQSETCANLQATLPE